MPVTVTSMLERMTSLEEEKEADLRGDMALSTWSMFTYMYILRTF